MTGSTDLLALERDGDALRGTGGSTGGLLDLGQRAQHRLGVGEAGGLGQSAQRDDEGERLIDGQPQRAVDALRVGQRDGVALELDLDQVARVVPRQAAQPQQVEVLAQPVLGDAEVGSGGREGDARPLQQVGHEREQPGQLVHGLAHAASPARACNLCTTAARASSGDEDDGVGAVAGRPGRRTARGRRSRARPRPSRARRARSCGRPAAAPSRCRRGPAPVRWCRHRRRRSGRPCCAGRCRRAGSRPRLARPAATTSPTIRRQPEDPGGAAQAVVADEVPAALPGHDAPRLDLAAARCRGGRWCGSRSAITWPSRTPARQASKLGSVAPIRGSRAVALSGVSTPAARSFSSALPVAPASGADCQSRAARPSAAASSGSRVISGSM